MGTLTVSDSIRLAATRLPSVPATSATKVLALLDAFRGSKSVLGVTELAELANVPKSTAHRLLTLMVDSGYVRKIGSRYCLTDILFELGNRVGSRAEPAVGLRRRAMPYLADMYSRTRETVHLAMLSGTDVLYLEKLYGPSVAPTPTAVGWRRPAHATALGKAILAFTTAEQLNAVVGEPLRRFTSRTSGNADELERSLMRVRSEGIAYDMGELRPAMSCVAAPVIDPSTGVAIAAVSISSVRTESLKRHVPPLRQMANELARLIPLET